MKLTLALVAASCLAQAADRPAALRFQAGQNGEFVFHTGILSGKVREKGRAIGLSSLVHAPTGLALSRGYGILSYYRVFSGEQRHGHGAWDWPSQARLLEDGALEVHWPAGGGRAFDLWSIYRWAAPDSLDFEALVRSPADVPDFEILLAAYFSPAFTQSAAYAKEGGKAAFLASEQSYGNWQLFPRDAAATALIARGRYKLPPNPVDWAIRPRLAGALAVRRAPAGGLAAILMADPAECIAIAMPHQTEQHYSVYYALFGRTIKAGQTARARGRLQFAVSPTDKQVVQIYRRYVKSLRRSR